MKVVQCSHWDLDGAGSIINVMGSIPKNAEYVWKASGYGKIEKIIGDATRGGFDIMFVTDLNYTEAQFRLLGKLKKKDNKIIYIDHHVYKDYDVEALGEKLGITVKWNREFSATKNVYNYFGGDKKIPHLTELTRIIDIYDIWRQEKSDFKTKAHTLNDLFWEYSMYKFIDKFKNGYKLDDEDKEVIKRRFVERKEHLESSFKNNSVINEEESILMIMNPDSKFTNDFTLHYPDYDVYLILCKAEDDVFQFSIRINPRIKLTVNDLNVIIGKTMKLPIQIGGHDITGGCTINQSQLPEFMEAFNNAVAEWRSSL
jgi:oligoribonuclease NrnB/cAMP/cGMP phosphodiesterase (DHH superfamily)